MRSLQLKPAFRIGLYTIFLGFPPKRIDRIGKRTELSQSVIDRIGVKPIPSSTTNEKSFNDSQPPSRRRLAGEPSRSYDSIQLPIFRLKTLLYF